MESATEIKRTSRTAGLLYLVMSLCAMANYFYLHRLFFFRGDPAATAQSILAKEQLYRVALLLDLVTQVLFILVVVALYRLFRDVDRNQARVMVALVGTGIAAQFAGFVLNAAPLVFLGNPEYLPAFTTQQLQALSYASLRLSDKQGEFLTAIWGLWLFPFGILTIKSRFLPKFLGALLFLTGVAYVVSSVTAIVFPHYVAAVGKLALPLYFGEFIVVLWLAFVGAKPRGMHLPGVDASDD
jgi:uncharacterized protein DUF4386